MKRIDYSAYILKKVATNSSRVGALIKVEWPEGFGYADLHPWPEFGDAYLKEQLKCLSDHLQSKQTTQLSKLQSQALYFSRLDALARAQSKSLFENLEIPESHYLITREEEINDENLSHVAKSGYKKLKVKVGGEPLMAAISIAELAGTAAQKLRLDVNALWSASDFKFFADKIPKEFKTRIEFIEDPFHSAHEHWGVLSQTYDFAFARDFEMGDSYAVRILKPAIDSIVELAEAEKPEVKFVVTSYLDHPLGQVSAAYEAARLKNKYGDRVLECGLLSQHVYEPNDFSKVFEVKNARFQNISETGSGFGFSKLLEKIHWKAI